MPFVETEMKNKDENIRKQLDNIQCFRDRDANLGCDSVKFPYEKSSLKICQVYFKNSRNSRKEQLIGDYSTCEDIEVLKI